ncbi:MAG: toxin-antitoxin system HicB family antitoxin [Acidimicrobiia bacterium]|nr:toxin-antitoxin system HicB family antitoxin [Acidimicrobiia bacterium]
MDIDGVIAEVTVALEGQLRLAGDDDAVVAAGEVMLTGLRPALRQLGTHLAEQAAAEVAAQLPDHRVDVVLEAGQPTLVVRQPTDTVTVSTDDMGARMTVRLSEDLKAELESAAADLGDSVNTFVVRALAGKTKGVRRSTRSTFEGTIET